MGFKRVLIRAALVVLGVAPFVQAQTSTSSSNGPVYCPPITCPDCFLTPTLLDALIYPGLTFWP